MNLKDEELEVEIIPYINVPEGIFLYSGNSKVLVFKGFIPFKYGLLRLRYKDNFRAIDITSKVYCQVWNIVIENSGFSSREDLVNYLSFYYNNITMRTPLTVIKYR